MLGAASSRTDCAFAGTHLVCLALLALSGNRWAHIARALGLEAYGVASDARPYARQPYYTAREIVARCKDLLYTLWQPLPTYLGTVIPVSGTGNAAIECGWYPLV